MEGSIGEVQYQKEGAKDIATTMVAATDVIVSTQVFALDAIAGVQAEQEAMKEGIEKTAEAVDMLAKEHDQIQLVVNDSEKEREAMSKGNEKAAAKVKATQNALYKLQLERSQSVIIIRNLPPITSNRETYEDLEKCVGRMLKDLHGTKIASSAIASQKVK